MPVTVAEGAVVGSDAWAPVVTAITGQISVANIMAAIASAAVVAIGFVFAWWGLRKVVRMIMGAFRKGRINP